MGSKLSVEELLTAADRALYEAKALGRGEVRLAPEAQAMRDAAA
jgi:PleD family two-component response regulator